MLVRVCGESGDDGETAGRTTDTFTGDSTVPVGFSRRSMKPVSSSARALATSRARSGSGSTTASSMTAVPALVVTVTDAISRAGVYGRCNLWITADATSGLLAISAYDMVRWRM
jgi:hypothetical protein